VANDRVSIFQNIGSILKIRIGTSLPLLYYTCMIDDSEDTVS